MNKMIRLSLGVIILVLSLVSTVGAEAQLDSVLGVPWGASPAQIRQIMEQNGFSYQREIKEPEGLNAINAMPSTYIIEFNRGVYAGYQVDNVYVEVMNNQMIKMRVYLWAENVGGEYMLNNVSDDLKKLLTEKYGVPSMIDRSHAYVPYTEFCWKLGGDKSITLNNRPAFAKPQWKQSGLIVVAYLNNGIYEALKNSSRQNI